MAEFEGGDRFDKDKIQQVAQEAIKLGVGRGKLTPEKMRRWTTKISEECIERLAMMKNQMKYLVFTDIMENAGAGTHFIMSAIWDVDKDNYVAVQFENQFIWVNVTIIGVGYRHPSHVTPFDDNASEKYEPFENHFFHKEYDHNAKQHNQGKFADLVSGWFSNTDREGTKSQRRTVTEEHRHTKNVNDQKDLDIQQREDISRNDGNESNQKDKPDDIPEPEIEIKSKTNEKNHEAAEDRKPKITTTEAPTKNATDSHKKPPVPAEQKKEGEKAPVPAEQKKESEKAQEGETKDESAADSKKESKEDEDRKKAKPKSDEDSDEKKESHEGKHHHKHHHGKHHHGKHKHHHHHKHHHKKHHKHHKHHHGKHHHHHHHSQSNE